MLSETCPELVSDPSSIFFRIREILISSVAADLPPDLSSNAFDALRAARADDRLYVPLCLNRLGRVINTHGDILVSNANLLVDS